MKKSDESNYRSLTHFFSKALFLGIGIYKVLINARESAIFSLLIGTILGSIIIYIINKTSYYNSKGIKKIIMFILIYVLFILGLAEFVNLISSIYLMDTDKFIILLPLLIVILYLNTKDITIHMKVSKILLSLSLCIFIINLISLIPNLDYLNYLPLFKVNIKNILFTSLEFALYSSVPNIIYGGIKHNIKDYNKKIIISYLLSNLALTFVILLTQGTLGIELIDLFRYPEYIILKKISMLDFINNTENIFSFLWIFTMFIYLSMCSKLLNDITYTKFNNKYIYPIFIFISIYIINNIIFDNNIVSLFLINYLWLILLIILIIYFITNINSLKKK